MATEIFLSLFYTSLGVGASFIVLTLAIIVCISILKRSIWKWIIKHYPPIKELITCIKEDDETGAFIALERLLKLED